MFFSDVFFLAFLNFYGIMFFFFLGDSLSFLPWDLSPLNPPFGEYVFFFQPPVHSQQAGYTPNIPHL